MDKDEKVKIDIRILAVIIVAALTFCFLFFEANNFANKLLGRIYNQDKFIKELI